MDIEQEEIGLIIMKEKLILKYTSTKNVKVYN